MDASAGGFEQDLRVPSRWAIATLALAVVALQPLSERLLASPLRIQVRGGTLAVLSVLAAAWLLERLHRTASAWLVVFLLNALVATACYWQRAPVILVLLAIPTGLAAALIGSGAALGTALAGTALLLYLPRAIGATLDGITAAVALAAMWATLAIVYAVYRPVRQVAEWSWGHYQEGQRVLGASRESAALLKQALEDLSHANRQLSLANERVSALRLIAEEAQKAKAEFVARVSHEFRTPLNMIIGLVDLMVTSPEVYAQDLPTAVAEDLRIVRRNCEHLTGMVNDVLALSQAEAGRLTLKREQVDLPEIIAAALAVVQPLLDKKGLGLQVSIPAGLPRIHCDPVRIRQVILNLASNAARLTEVGEIAIRVQQKEGQVVVRVSDTGPGIPPEDLERIFEPFCQGTGRGRDRTGSGLGLTISKQFVELHGGGISVESKVGSGATFSFTLPLSPPMEHLAGPTRWISEHWAWVERRSRPETPAAPPRPRIVVCDDDGDLCTALARCSDEIDLVGTCTVAQAREEAERCPAHAVILNAASPAYLWPLVEQASREIGDTPIIGWAVPPAERALKAGATAYLTKPVTRAALEGAMRAAGALVRRVLVVDDDAEVVKLWTMMLAAYDSGLEIATAANGEEALARLRSQPPDLVLLDIIMPGLDGWRVLALKGEDAAIRDIPVILVSAQDPRGQPPGSPTLMAAMGGGLSVDKLLHCSLEISALLLKPD